jgi:hypothetical protein
MSWSVLRGGACETVTVSMIGTGSSARSNGHGTIRLGAGSLALCWLRAKTALKELNAAFSVGDHGCMLGNRLRGSSPQTSTGSYQVVVRQPVLRSRRQRRSHSLCSEQTNNPALFTSLKNQMSLSGQPALQGTREVIRAFCRGSFIGLFDLVATRTPPDCLYFPVRTLPHA